MNENKSSNNSPKLIEINKSKVKEASKSTFDKTVVNEESDKINKPIINNTFDNNTLINSKNNFNNIFSNFNGSSILNPQINNMTITKSKEEGPTKERKSIDNGLTFNSLFNNSLINSNNLTNNVINKTANVKTVNINSTSSPRLPNSNVFYSVKEYYYKEDHNKCYRNTMEDFSKIVDNFMNNKTKGLFTLYDGHGGCDPVKYVKERMPEIISKFIEKNETENNSIENALINSFHKIDEELKFYDSENSGLTATVLLITPDYMNKGARTIFTANVGDSKCILITSNEVKQLSYDHKCSDNSEVERIRETGGVVFSGRVFGQLVLTRALGDHAMKKYGVISTPYISKYVIEDNYKYVIIASDGLWDVILEDEVFKLSQEIKKTEEFAKTLVENALLKGSKDNISCIVIKIN
jgi:protein phosphatase PTC1